MKPVAAQPEPPHFDNRVRTPGATFLAKVPNPTTSQWGNNNFWNLIAEELRTAYDAVCAYSAQWISRVEGSPSVDHFVPKSAAPHLAYEWTNYRFACRLCNARKRDYRDVLDPFTLTDNSFVMDFPSLLIKSNQSLSPASQLAVDATIGRLRLNDENSVRSRLEWLLPYCQGECVFKYLREKAPFLAYELDRQDPIENIKGMMTR